MKNNKFTESKAENSPSGGVLVGKRKGQTIIHNKGTLSGYLVGKTHDEGGIKAINKSTGQPLEMQGGEVVITAPAVADQTKREFNGEMLTNREILSKINEMGGGVSFAKGGDIPEKMKCSGASYNYGGKTMTDHEIMMLINNGGHLAKGMTLKQIADKHDVTLSKLNHQVKLGLKAESEHTSSKREQMQIVKDHLFENPEYYTLLKKAGLKKGGEVKTWKQKYNKKYGYPVNESHDLEEIAKDTGISLKGLQQIYNKGIGAYKTNPESVRPNVKSKEQWAMARVYSAVMGGKASKVDANELKMKKFIIGGYNAKTISDFENPKEAMEYVDKEIVDKAVGIYIGGKSSKVDANELKMKRGGQVKEDLVKDSKKGDHTSRDLNNYNDLMDVGVDGKVGELNGLELADGVGGADASGGVGAFAKGGSLDFLDDVDKIFARGGATDVVVNNWNEIPDDFKNIRLPSRLISWSPNPSNDGLYEIAKPFLSKDDLRPAMQGINFDKNGITITNAHILLTIPKPSVDFEGIYKPVKVTSESLKKAFPEGFTKIDAKYPNYENVIPKEQDITKVFDFINIEKLLTYCKVAKNYAGNETIVFKINDEQMQFDADYIIDFLTSWMKLTGFGFPYVSFQTNKKALAFTMTSPYKFGENIIALIMPYTYGGSFELGARNKKKNAELNVYFDFDDNNIHNSDGSIVTDWMDKPKKTRAKRTPKATLTELPDFINISDSDSVKDLPTPLQDLIVYELMSQGATEKKEIQSILKTSTINGAVAWDKTKDGIDFWINLSNGNLILFKEKYGKAGEKATELLAKLLAKKSETPVEPETKELDLTNTKIWIGDNELLLRAVQKRAFQLGWSWAGSVKEVSYLKEAKGLYFHKDKTITFTQEKTNFNKKQGYKEIFVSDLRLTPEQLATPVEPETKTPFDLANTKIWFGDNEELSKRVQERVFELGWRWNAGGKDFKPEITSLYLTANNILFYGKEKDKERFNVEQEREIFESDLFQETKKIVSTQEMIIQPSQSADVKPNFELERKFLTSRINELSLELNVKKIILTKEEATFYQREINKFISLLRNLNEKELSTKLISDRFDSIYSVKFGDFKKEYPSADLKSINGLPTQLTEKEYLDVRTPEFRAFFGDWQDAYLTGNYESVSKVINEKTKEPMPVYHGTNVLFTNWKTYDTNNAHYFAVRRDFSDFFATTWEERVDKSALDSKTIKNLNPNKGTFMFRCFIDVKNPIDFSKFGVDKYPVSDFLTYLKINYNISDYDFWTNIDLKSGVDKQTMVYAWQIIRLWQSFTQYVKLFTTHDGYIFYEYLPDSEKRGMEDASLCYCAFDSNQIKFNDAYEFNALSNDSRFDFGGKL